MRSKPGLPAIGEMLARTGTSGPVSFNELVDACEQASRQIQAQRLCSLQIEHELEFLELLDRQISRFGAFEDAVDVRGGAFVLLDAVNPVGHQAAFRGKAAIRVDRREAKFCRSLHDQLTMHRCDAARWHYQPKPCLSRECIEGLLYFRSVVNVPGKQLD